MKRRIFEKRKMVEVRRAKEGILAHKDRAEYHMAIQMRKNYSAITIFYID